jgi:hypothetical protein
LSCDVVAVNSDTKFTDVSEEAAVTVFRVEELSGETSPLCSIINRIYILGKGKAVPLQAWSGPEGSRKLRFSGFKTTAEDGGKVVSLTHRPPLLPGNIPGTHFC